MTNPDGYPEEPDAWLQRPEGTTSLEGITLRETVQQTSSNLADLAAGKPLEPRRLHRRKKKSGRTWRRYFLNEDVAFVTARDGARILGGVDPRAVVRLASAGLVGVRNIPGVRARYSRDDLVRISREALRPARVLARE
jgi:hypothetical protein